MGGLELTIVYVLVQDAGYDGQGNEAVFSSKEKAEAPMNTHSCYGEWHIETYVLDGERLDDD